MSSLSPVDALQRLRSLYGVVDERVRALEARHSARLNCTLGCTSCCVDDISVFEVEATNIQRQHSDLLAEGVPHPQGACAFLGEGGACRIYESRPYVCRTHGLPLRWEEWENNNAEDDLDDFADPEPPTEHRDICPLNVPGEALDTIPPEDCLTLGDFEGQMAQIQAELDGWALKRVTLRSLFLKS